MYLLILKPNNNKGFKYVKMQTNNILSLLIKKNSEKKEKKFEKIVF